MCDPDPELDPPQPVTPAANKPQTRIRRPVQRRRRGRLRNTMQAMATPPKRLPHCCGMADGSSEAVDAATVVMLTATVDVVEVESFTLTGFRLHTGKFCALVDEAVSVQLRFIVPA